VDAGGLVKQARRRAGLSQRELSRRTGLDQAVIGRIEAGRASPRFDTLERLLAAAGHELVLLEQRPADADRWAVRAALALTDREREAFFVQSNRNMLRMFSDAQPRE
jgi:transcriptional regulator with XRE-family HTH domain